MKNEASFSRKKTFEEAVLMGASLGLVHALVESTLLGWYGVALGGVDLALLAFLWMVIFVALGTAVGVVGSLWAGGVSVIAGNAGRKLTWTLLLLSYCLVLLKILSYWSGWGVALKWMAPVIPVVLLSWLIVLRRVEKTSVILAGMATIALTLCALQLLHAEWGDLPPSNRVPLALGLGLSGVLALVATLVLGGAKSPGARPFRPWPPLAIAALIALGLWSTVLPRPLRWRIVRSTATTEPAQARLNFILIVLDTVRADHMDLFGYERETMPNLRRFAEQECQTAQPMVATSSWTLPSHASMFTGLYPHAHGAHAPFVTDTEFEGAGYSLREDVPTLPEFLEEHGYHTAGIAANRGYLSAFGLPRGFRFLDTSPPSSHLANRIGWASRLRMGRGPSLFDRVRGFIPVELSPWLRFFASVDMPYRQAHEITDAARDWLDHQGGRPFFLFLNYMDAHIPYVSHRIEDAPLPPELESYEFSLERYQAQRYGTEELTPEERDILVKLYDVDLRYLDRELGRLLDIIKDGAFYQDTMIIITTDHGESFLENGYLGHRNDLHVVETGGFLILRIPPSLRPVEPSPVMQFVDFFPTIASTLNQPIPAHIQGSPWGKGRDYALSELYCVPCSQWIRSRRKVSDKTLRELVAVVIGDRKLVRSTNGVDEVYRIRGSSETPLPAGTIDSSFLARAEAILAERDRRTFREHVITERDERLIERLRSLGYVQ